ncbi:MAG: hypothetical protein ACRETQ_00410 [Gammaproteobacteria bacterium]
MASTALRVDALNGAIGTELNLERDLRLPDRRVIPDATAGWRFTRRSSLELNYIDLEREANNVIDRTLHYGGVDFTFNTTIRTFSDLRTASLIYRYKFVDAEAFSLSAHIGLHATRFAIGLSDQNTGASRSVDAQAPLPLAGLDAGFNAGAWRFNVEADYLKMTVNRIRGHLNKYTVSVMHPLGAGFSAELGYTTYVLSLFGRRSTFTGDLRYAYQGPFLNLCYGCQPER